jgi:polyvinyl alcohol dehydrogenase (cytochrome)
MRSKLIVQSLLVGLVATTIGVIPSAADTATCAAPSTGGDWAQHGGDLLGTRSQPGETTLSKDNVLNLAHKWSASSAALGAAGNIQTIPIVADGCVYVQTSSSGFWLVALNADTGEVVWKRQLGSGGCHNAPVVRNGIVYVNEPTQRDGDTPGPHLLALNAKTGEVIFVGDEVATEASTGANAGCAAPVGLLGDYALIGITNGEMDGLREGGFAVVDATTGKRIKRTYIVPDDEKANGFGGCSIWSGWSIDPIKKVAFTGTAQPSTWTGAESELCNAIIKIDLDPSHSSFGEVIGAAKGTHDDPPYVDVDFGSSPTVATDANGQQVVGQLQKSGWFHAAYTRHMTNAWALPVSPIGAPLGNYTASATDGTNFFTVGAYPGQLISLNSSTGLPNWVVPVISPIATNSVAYANGVVYYGDEKGFLSAFDSATGAPLFTHPVIADNSACTRNQSGGVAIARHKVYMACGSVIAAYGL